MKKILFTITMSVAIFLILFGCVPKREVIGNNYVSSRPPVSVKISPEFRSWGTYRYEMNSSDFYDPSGLNKGTSKIELTLIVPTQMQNQQFDKGILILVREFTSPGWNFVGTAYSATSKYILSHGMASFSGVYYEHATRVRYNDMKDSSSQQIYNAGLIMPNCALAKSYVRTEGKDLRIFIHYFEDVSPSGFGKDMWLDKTKYVEAQHKYIEEFEKRANKAFEIQ